MAFLSAKKIGKKRAFVSVLATASMMQVARLTPAGIAEEGVYVAVSGIYLGLASGATLSFVLAREVLRVGDLHCG